MATVSKPICRDTSESLQRNLANLGSLGRRRGKMQEQGEQWKLDVSNPKVGLGALENHLETDTREPGRDT